jgi:hypothetical protein
VGDFWLWGWVINGCLADEWMETDARHGYCFDRLNTGGNTCGGDGHWSILGTRWRFKAAVRMVCHAPQVAEARTPQQMDVLGQSLLYAESVVRILVYCQPATVTCHVANKVLC